MVFRCLGHLTCLLVDQDHLNKCQVVVVVLLPFMVVFLLRAMGPLPHMEVTNSITNRGHKVLLVPCLVMDIMLVGETIDRDKGHSLAGFYKIL